VAHLVAPPAAGRRTRDNVEYNIVKFGKDDLVEVDEVENQVNDAAQEDKEDKEDVGVDIEAFYTSDKFEDAVGMDHMTRGMWSAQQTLIRGYLKYKGVLEDRVEVFLEGVSKVTRENLTDLEGVVNKVEELPMGVAQHSTEAAAFNEYIEFYKDMSKKLDWLREKQSLFLQPVGVTARLTLFGAIYYRLIKPQLPQGNDTDGPEGEFEETVVGYLTPKVKWPKELYLRCWTYVSTKHVLEGLLAKCAAGLKMQGSWTGDDASDTMDILSMAMKRLDDNIQALKPSFEACVVKLRLDDVKNLPSFKTPPDGVGFNGVDLAIDMIRLYVDVWEDAIGFFKKQFVDILGSAVAIMSGDRLACESTDILETVDQFSKHVKQVWKHLVAFQPFPTTFDDKELFGHFETRLVSPFRPKPYQLVCFENKMSLYLSLKKICGEQRLKEDVRGELIQGLKRQVGVVQNRDCAAPSPSGD
jgi:archaellum component FlaC